MGITFLCSWLAFLRASIHARELEKLLYVGLYLVRACVRAGVNCAFLLQLKKLAMRLKKENVSIDVVNFGELVSCVFASSCFKLLPHSLYMPAAMCLRTDLENSTAISNL